MAMGRSAEAGTVSDLLRFAGGTFYCGDEGGLGGAIRELGIGGVDGGGDGSSAEAREQGPESVVHGERMLRPRSGDDGNADGARKRIAGEEIEEGLQESGVRGPVDGRAGDHDLRSEERRVGKECK